MDVMKLVRSKVGSHALTQWVMSHHVLQYVGTESEYQRKRTVTMRTILMVMGVTHLAQWSQATRAQVLTLDYQLVQSCVEMGNGSTEQKHVTMATLTMGMVALHCV